MELSAFLHLRHFSALSFGFSMEEQGDVAHGSCKNVIKDLLQVEHMQILYYVHDRPKEMAQGTRVLLHKHED